MESEVPHGPRGRGTRRALVLYALVALSFTVSGLLPGRILLPLDVVADVGAWKPDPRVRVPVSNSLLSDPILQSRPWELQARRSIAAGRPPWTNPYAGDGVALFSNPAAGLLSPFTWIRLLLGDRGWAPSMLLKLVLAGLGLRRFARELGAGDRAALASGLVYMLSGFSILWGLHPQTNVFAFLPWLGAASHRLLFRPSAPSAALVVVFAALATAGGHPETLAFGVIALALFLALEFRAGREAPMPRPSRRSAALALLAAASGFSLVAIQLVPFGMILRGSRVVHLRSLWSGEWIRPFAIVGQILPGFLGSPLAGEIDLSGAFFGSGNMHARSGAFVGLVAIVAMALALRSLPPAFRRCLLVAALGLAMSWSLPPLGWLWRRTPIVSLFAIEYAAAAFVLFAALAFGPSVQALSERAGRLRAAAGPLILGGALLVAGGILPSLPLARPAIAKAARGGISRLQERGYLRRPAATYQARFQDYLQRGRATALRRAALPGCFWILGGLALAARRRRDALLTLAACGELVAFGWGYLPSVSRSRTPGPAPAIADLQARAPGFSEMIAASKDVYPPDLATVDGLRDVRCYEYLETEAWAARLRRCGYDEIARGFPDDLSAEQANCLAESGVRYFLSRSSPPGATRVGGGEPPAVGAYELPAALPAVPPRDGPPAGTLAGALVSLAAVLGALAVVRASRRRFTV